MRELVQKSINEIFKFEKADTKNFKIFSNFKADNRSIQTSKADNRYIFNILFKKRKADNFNLIS